MLPVGTRFNAPVLVIVIPVPTILLVLTLPPVMLPAAEINPPVNKLPPVTLPLALIVVDWIVVRLAMPAVVMLPLMTLPVAVISPGVLKFPTEALPNTCNDVKNTVFDNARPVALAEIIWLSI